MSHDDLIAEAHVHIDAPRSQVWQALTDPKIIAQYMFGAVVASDWSVGSAITWSGTWEGKDFQDHGEIFEIVPEQRLKYSHFSPLTGEPDVPENYHTVLVKLSDADGGTDVELLQDNNSSDEAKEHSEQTWNMMLAGLKKTVEA